MDVNQIRVQAVKICKDYRKTNKITQTELANLAGVSLRSVQNIEHSVTVFDETLQKVLKACGWTYGIEVRRWLEEDKMG